MRAIDYFIFIIIIKGGGGRREGEIPGGLAPGEGEITAGDLARGRGVGQIKGTRNPWHTRT